MTTQWKHKEVLIDFQQVCIKADLALTLLLHYKVLAMFVLSNKNRQRPQHLSRPSLVFTMFLICHSSFYLVLEGLVITWPSMKGVSHFIFFKISVLLLPVSV